jgi:serine phosphatase RsbU (regulator of sigma subunit)
VQRNLNGNAEQLFDAVHDAVIEFVGGATQKDDLTLLVLGYQGDAG